MRFCPFFWHSTATILPISAWKWRKKGGDQQLDINHDARNYLDSGRSYIFNIKH